MLDNKLVECPMECIEGVPRVLAFGPTRSSRCSPDAAATVPSRF